VETLSVLHVAQPLTAGVPRVAGDLVRDQRARGWRVGFACPEPSELREVGSEAGATYLRWEATRSPSPLTAGETARLNRLIGDFDPDLVHLHSAKAGLAGRLALRGRIPTVFQPHAWSFEAVGGALRAAAIRWERLATRWTDTIICVSNDERRCGVERGIRAHWTEIPNGVDVGANAAASAEDRERARSELGLDGAPLVVAAGRLCEQKGQDILLRAWPQVTAALPEARLALVGDGPWRTQLETSAPSGVLFAGYSTAVPAWLAAADVVALPSRWEGLSLVLLEAMAAGRSVVASDAGGMRQTLTSECGAIVPAGDDAGLAAALRARLLDPGLAADEGAAARRRVERLHDVRDVAAQVARAYRDVLERRRLPAAIDVRPLRAGEHATTDQV